MICDPHTWPAWEQCAGRAALERDEPGDTATDPMRGFTLVRKGVVSAQQQAFRDAVHERHSALGGLLRPADRLDLSVLTAERGAVVTVDALFLGDTTLELWQFGDVTVQELQIFALCALVKYEMLHAFELVTLVRFEDGPDVQAVTTDELYVFGARVTQAAYRALKLTAEAPVAHDLTRGPWCAACRAAWRCPAQALDLV